MALATPRFQPPCDSHPVELHCPECGDYFIYADDIAACIDEHGHCTFCHAKAAALEAATVDAEINNEDWTVEARRNLNADLLPRSA